MPTIVMVKMVANVGQDSKALPARVDVAHLISAGVLDKQANVEFFGYPGASRGSSAFPQARLMGLVECGTHAVVAADIAPYSHSEQETAAPLLLAKLTPEMLVLADRAFYGFELWQIGCASGAKPVWRVKANLKLPAQQMLDDDSSFHGSLGRLSVGFPVLQQSKMSDARNLHQINCGPAIDLAHQASRIHVCTPVPSGRRACRMRRLPTRTKGPRTPLTAAPRLTG